jgi:hypothetical protein
MTLAQLLKLTPEQALRLYVMKQLLHASRGLATPLTVIETAFFTPVLAEVIMNGEPPEDEYICALHEHWAEAFGLEMEEAIEEAETAVKN